jgi:hypothetical protein
MGDAPPGSADELRPSPPSTRQRDDPDGHRSAREHVHSPVDAEVDRREDEARRIGTAIRLHQGYSPRVCQARRATVTEREVWSEGKTFVFVLPSLTRICVRGSVEWSSGSTASGRRFRGP